MILNIDTERIKVVPYGLPPGTKETEKVSIDQLQGEIRKLIIWQMDNANANQEEKNHVSETIEKIHRIIEYKINQKRGGK